MEITMHILHKFTEIVVRLEWNNLYKLLNIEYSKFLEMLVAIICSWCLAEQTPWMSLFSNFVNEETDTLKS